jgi:ABC-type glycerol-3-phosphate transport system substrate-binding protein
VVSANTKHAEAAWKLVEFLALNEDSLRTFNAATGTIPALVAVAENPGEILDKAPFVAVPLGSDALVNGRYIGPLGDRDRFFYEIININIEKAMLGELTVQEALQQIETSANELIDSEINQ